MKLGSINIFSNNSEKKEIGNLNCINIIGFILNYSVIKVVFVDPLINYYYSLTQSSFTMGFLLQLYLYYYKY